MNILAIDTSSKNCSVALVKADKNNFNVIDFKNNDDEKTHSQKLMPLIQEIFEESKLTLDDINLLVCCVGPGSFTGIRIGVASVKAFADAKEIPCVGITSLESLAYNIKSDGSIVSIIDAKNGNIYSGIFSNTNSSYKNEQPEIADNLESVLENYTSFFKNSDVHSKIYFVGDGSIAYKNAISENFNNFNIEFSEDNIQSSISLAQAGYDKYNSGTYGDSNFISPIYLRPSQAERTLN